MLAQQQEEVFSLFKELIDIINDQSKAQKKIPTELEKSPTISKESVILSQKKQKISERYCKDTQSGQATEKPLEKTPKVKALKKQISKQGRKELRKEQQSKLKQQIFNDYSSIMTYKIHKKQINTEKEKKKGSFGRKTLSINQNITLMIEPQKKEEITVINQ